jgi:hypothetical protein
MAGRFDYVEEALTPFGIVRHGSWLVSRCERMVVKCVRSAGRDSSVCRRFMPARDLAFLRIRQNRAFVEGGRQPSEFGFFF